MRWLLEEVRRKDYQKLGGPGRDCQVPLSSRGMWQMAVQALSFKKKKLFIFFATLYGLWDLSSPGVEPFLLAVEVWSPNHSTTRKSPFFF